MSSTKNYQVKPDFFSSEEECLKAGRNRINTNPRYKKDFFQTHFTAGDIEQFQNHRDATNGQVCIPNITLDGNIFDQEKLPQQIHWQKYQNLNPKAVDNTFQYMFNKFKKGIFLKVKQGKLNVFLPFSNKNFTNEWSSRIKVDPKYKDLLGFIKYIQIQEGRKFFAKNVNRFVDSWYSNNCLLRYEYPVSEGDTNTPNMSDMFKCLCEEREVPDIEFFVNRRDFPLIKTDGTEPYTHIYDSNNHPLLSHKYDKYSPILSMVGCKGYADIPIPTGDDWARATRPEGKYFLKTCNRSYNIEKTPWEERKPIAVFRGGSTGCGTTIDTNIRLKASYMSSLHPVDDDGERLLDVGITNWNARPRKLKGEKYLQTIDIKSLPFGLVDKLSPQEQTQYKYILHLDGHVSAYRLGLELSMGSCILLPASKYSLWYRPMLKPMVHYVPVKADLSDLLEKIKWCKKNDIICKKIAKNARKFAKNYLTKEGILDYLQKLLYELKKSNGVYLYNNNSLEDIQYNDELSNIQNRYYPPTTKNLSDITLFPSQERSPEFFQGVEWVVNMVLDQGNFEGIAKKGKVIFNNNLNSVTKYELGGYTMVKKLSRSVERKKANVHEAFVMKNITNELLKSVPIFAYNFGSYEDEEGIHMLMEYVEGQTLNEYIKSKNFNMYNYLSVLLHLCLALQVAQKQNCFVHWDLTPWNIVLRKLEEPVVYDYVISPDKVYRVKTDLVPVIIDMGRSHVVYKNRHYGMIKMFETKTFQDIITILNTSIFEITNKENLSKKAVVELVLLANCLTGTKYHPKPFRLTGKGGLGDIRYFLNRAKKYTELITSDKGELESLSPMYLFNYIREKFKYRFSINVISGIEHAMIKGNSRQIFEYTFCKTDQERALTFAHVFKRIKNCQLDIPDNIIFSYYALQTLEEHMTSVYAIMMKFLKEKGIESKKYVKKYRKTLEHLSDSYDLDKEPEEIDYIIPKSPRIKYDENTFLFPEDVLKLLEQTCNINVHNPNVYREIVEDVLLKTGGRFALPEKLMEFYRKNFDQLISIDPVTVNERLSDLSSLRVYAKKVYKQDYEWLSEKERCESSEKYLKTYEKILKMMK